MRKIVMFLDTGYPSLDAKEYFLVPEDFDDAELDKLDKLDDISQRRALEYAAAYDIYPYSKEAEYDQDADADEQGIQLSHDINGYWEYYDPAIHRTYGVVYWKKLDELF